MPPLRFALLLLLAAGPAQSAAPPLVTPAVGETDWALYGAQLRAAHRAWELGRVAEAWRELEACRWDLRGWEHRHLCALLMRNQAILGRNWGNNHIAFTPDGRLLIHPYRDRPRFHDAGTFAYLQGHLLSEGKQDCIAVSGDGRRYITGGEENTVQVWGKDLTKSPRRWIGHANPITAIAVTHDGSRVASGSHNGARAVAGSYSGSLRVWDADTGKKLFDLVGHAESLSGMAFSPDGSLLVSWDRQSIRLWDARTGRPLRGRLDFGSSGGEAAFGPDGKRVIVFGKDSAEAVIGDATTGRALVRLRGHEAEVCRVAFGPDGLRVATGTMGGVLRVWESRTGRLLGTYRGHKGYLGSLAFSPDGTRLVTSGDDGTVRLWDIRGAARGRLPNGWSFQDRSGSIGVSPDGSRAVVFRELHGRKGFGGDSLSARTLDAWDLKTGQPLYDYEWDSEVGPQCLAVSPDGKRLATGEADGFVRIRDAATGVPVREYAEHSGRVVCIAWSADGKRIVSANRAGVVKIRDDTTGRRGRAFSAAEEDPTSLAFSPDGALLACGYPRSVRVWDATTGKRAYDIADVEEVRRVGFSPDGARLVCIAARRGVGRNVAMHDARTGRFLSLLAAPRDEASDFAYSPDGSRLLTWNDQGVLRMWEGKSNVLLLTQEATKQDCFAFAPAGRLLASRELLPPRYLEARAGRDALALEDSVQVSEDELMVNRDGSLIAARVETSIVRVWDARSGRLVLHAVPFAGAVGSLAFTTDGKALVATEELAPRRSRTWILQTVAAPGKPSAELEAHPTRTLPGDKKFEKRDDRILILYPEQRKEDLDRTSRWARPDFVYHQERLWEAELDGDDLAADFHLRPLLRDPFHAQDALLHYHHALVLARRGKAQESTARLAWAVLLRPQNYLRLQIPDGQLHAEKAADDEDWARAARIYRLIDLDNSPYPTELSELLAQVAQGLPAASRLRLPPRLCEYLDCPTDAGVTRAFWLALAVSDGGTPSCRSLFLAAEVGHRKAPTPAALGRLGAAQYRIGRYEDAARNLARAAAAPEGDETPFVRLFQSLAAKQLGRDADAKSALARAEASYRLPVGWRDRVALAALFAEARAALAAPPPMPRVPEGE